MGSKMRVVDAIRAAIDTVDPENGRVLDLFSGSGVVAADLARNRPVTTVDIQEYARVLASALLAPARLAEAEVAELVERAAAAAETLAEGELCRLLQHEAEAVAALGAGDPLPFCEIVEGGSLAAFEVGDGPATGTLASILTTVSASGSARDLTLTGHYGGVFFSYRQALQLDCLLAAVGDLVGAGLDTGLAAILGAASETVTSVGSHFAQPIRPRDRNGAPKLTPLRSAARRREREPLLVFAGLMSDYANLPTTEFEFEAIRADYREFLAASPAQFSAVYADPPYTRDHYSRFYHVLETIARCDDPSLSTVTQGGATAVSRGLYRVDRHQSPFCIRSQAPAAFANLFRGTRELGAPLVLSYSPYSSGTAARPQPRLLTIDDLCDLAAAEFGEVRVHSAGRVSHSRFNARRLNGAIEAEAESLLVCVP
jgi:16S rRNA G966 N2-methylase RsmD